MHGLFNREHGAEVKALEPNVVARKANFSETLFMFFL